MTVVAWDGRYLAADSMATSCDMRIPVVKIARHGNTVLTSTGSREKGMLLREWYLKGADPREWPEFQKDDYARLLVLTAEGLFEYETLPVGQPVTAPYMAFGSGRDYAMGAMAMGADAVQAVECAIKHCVTCGGPVVWFERPQ